MQTTQNINVYLPSVLANIIMQYLGSQMYHLDSDIAKNGLFEECFAIDKKQGLIGAIEGQHEHIIELMFKHGARVNIEHLVLAGRCSSVVVIQLIIKLLAENSPAIYLEGLKKIFRSGKNDVFMYLINSHKPSDLTPLLTHACFFQNVTLTKYLLSHDRKYYPDFDQTIKTQLLCSVADNNSDICELLRPYCNSPIDWDDYACRAWNTLQLKYALDQGANDYDRIFMRHLIRRNPSGEIRLLLPFVSLEQLNVVAKNDKLICGLHLPCVRRSELNLWRTENAIKLIKRLVHRELFYRAVSA